MASERKTRLSKRGNRDDKLAKVRARKTQAKIRKLKKDGVVNL